MPRRHRPPPPTSPLSLSPLRILTQILTLQLLYYLCVTSLLLFTALTAGRPFSPDLVLSWRSLRGDTAGGWTLGVCWVAGGVCGTLLLPLLIARSKLVPDFALTLHGIHLLLTSLYSHSLPANALWWVLQAASAGVMVAGGVWCCRWRELRPISFGGGGKVGGKVGGESGGGGWEREGGEGEGEEEEGYEMVGMEEGGGAGAGAGRA